MGGTTWCFLEKKISWFFFGCSGLLCQPQAVSRSLAGEIQDKQSRLEKKIFFQKKIHVVPHMDFWVLGASPDVRTAQRELRGTSS